MQLRNHKTKIVATIGPACESREMLERLIGAGMSIARLNFSHGDFASHKARIDSIREAERRTGKAVAIMADLPGPKMRVGRIDPQPVQLLAGARFTLTRDNVIGDVNRVSMSFEGLPEVVKKGDRLFLNDGLVQLIVEGVAGSDVHCTVVTGGELSSRKGLNLPGIDLGVSAFTNHDRECLKFALEHGVDAISQSFVETADDIAELRKTAASLGKNPFIIAKIERSGALKQIESILKAADGIMVARGDLGVEVPIEEITMIQKDLIARANQAGKPVITATQMLESMTNSRLPTRAEATDVANAILDGTDCIMLSAESAVGKFPEEAVAMLARIAGATELRRTSSPRSARVEGGPMSCASEAIAAVVEQALKTVPCAAVFVPTRTGTTARRISSLKPAVWIAGVTLEATVFKALLFSYGVSPVAIGKDPEDWNAFAADWLQTHGIAGPVSMLVAGPSPRNPQANHRIEFMQKSGA